MGKTMGKMKETMGRMGIWARIEDMGCGTTRNN
jgi:hypothetical protein